MSRQRYCNANPRGDEDVPMEVEAIQRFVEGIERVARKGVAPDQVTEVEKCRDAFDHLGRDVTGDGC